MCFLQTETLQKAGAQPKLPALLARVIIYIYHYYRFLHLESQDMTQSVTEWGVERHRPYLHQEHDFQQEVMAITMSPLVLTALEAQESSKVGKCFSVPCNSIPYVNMQPRVAKGS